MFTTSITLVGIIVSDPVLRVTKSGIRVTSFRVVSTARRRERHAGRVLEEQLEMTVNCWRGLADNAAASLSRGTPVIAEGRLRVRYPVSGSAAPTDPRPAQVDRTARAELDAFAIGPDLRFGTAAYKAPKPVAVRRMEEAVVAEATAVADAAASAAPGGAPGAGEGTSRRPVPATAA